jgi:outer membrane protein TolC
VIRRGLFPIILAIAFHGAAAGARAQDGSDAGPASPVFSHNDYQGSVASQPVAGTLPLSLQDAIDRGLKQNLGVLISNSDIRSSSGQRWQQLSALLPHLTLNPYVDVSEVSLAEFGFSFKIPGINFPSIVGPFSYFDARFNLSQEVFNWSSINNVRASKQHLESARHTYQDARDLVVLSVGFSYLQAVATEARVETVQAQVQTAQALYDQASDQVKAGTSPSIDGLRAQVELKTRQQELIAARNDLEIQKLGLARTIGLASGQQFEMTDKSQYSAFEGITVDEALKRAYASRSDFQAALADVRAAEYSKHAAQAEHYPSLAFSADFGAAGQHPATSSHDVFDVRGTLNIPIFQGGAIHGDVLVADAELQQSRDRLENLRGQIDADVRTALLNLESSQQQVDVAQSNIQLAEETLAQSRDRFSAGVTDTVEVVQAQESVATAHESYISSLYSFNYAKISLARALGAAEEGVKEYFKGR